MDETVSPDAAGGPDGLEQRVRFTRLAERDRERLRELEPLLNEISADLVDRFYAHLRSYPELERLLGDDRSVARLKKHQLRYVRSLSDARYDRAYADDRRRIGEVHERIGLTPAWYIGTYAVYFDQLLPELIERMSDDLPRAAEQVRALVKQMLLDMQLVLEVYFRQRERTIVSHAEQLATVGRLAAGVAHEVRNPLAGIRGALQVIQRDPALPAQHSGMMDEVVGQIDRLEHLVRDLLTYARPRGIRPTLIELRPLFERHAHLARQGPTAIVTRVDVDDRATVLSADAEQLEQVLLNLIQNAVAAMPEGGALTLGSRRRAGRLELFVRDNGEGMSDRDAASAFTPFYTTRHRGSGLGLSIVEGIVQRHDGRVAITTAPGSGTTVTLSFPRTEAG